MSQFNVMFVIKGWLLQGSYYYFYGPPPFPLYYLYVYIFPVMAY